MKPLETRESRTASRGIFEKIYEDYNRREYVSPDPLQFLYDYEDTVDREAVGLIASGLAYGRVAHILKSVSLVLDTLGPHPAEYLKSTSYRDHEAALCGFVHRFTGDLRVPRRDRRGAARARLDRKSVPRGLARRYGGGDGEPRARLLPLHGAG